jgi:hypothetical protein
MFINNFNKIIISELKYVLSEMPEEDRNVENLIEKFSEYIGMSGSVKPKKTVKSKDPLPAEIRCNALKKDGDQCNGRKNNKENPEVVLCSLHVRSGAKFGYLQETTESSETEEPSSSVEVPVVVAPKKAAAKRTRKAKTPEVVVEEESAQDVMDDLNDLAKVISKHTDCDDNEEADFE